MGSLNPLLLAGVAAVGVGTILLIVSVATPGWSVNDVPGGKSEIGPFKSCGTSGGAELCFSTSLEIDSFNAVKALTIIGLLCAFGALLVLVLILVLPLIGKDQISVLPIAAAGLAGGAFGFTIIGDIVWGAKVQEEISALFDLGYSIAPYDLGYSFALSIVGAIIVIIGGVLGFLGGKKTG